MTDKPRFNALDALYHSMVDACLARMDEQARRGLLDEWTRQYSHRDNPAWVVYDLARSDD